MPKPRTRRRRKTSKRTNKRRGGAKIGEGAYARIIYPGVPCKNSKKDPSTYVTKVSSRETLWYDPKQLKEIIERLKKVDPKGEYFILPEFCEYGELSEENKKDRITYKEQLVGSYNMVKAEGNLSKKVYHTYMEIYNITYPIYKETDKAKAAEMAEKNRAIVKEKLISLLPMLDRVIKIHDKLLEARVLHNDMWATNIVEMKDGSLRLIDFDMASPLELEENPKDEFEIFVKTCFHVDSLKRVYPEMYESFMRRALQIQWRA